MATLIQHEHTPHNPDSMQTVCEQCEKEIFYDAVSDSWIAFIVDENGSPKSITDAPGFIGS